MKIIILGAGQVGTSLANNLASEANDITVVDVNADLLSQRHLGEQHQKARVKQRLIPQRRRSAGRPATFPRGGMQASAEIPACPFEIWRRPASTRLL